MFQIPASDALKVAAAARAGRGNNRMRQAVRVTNTALEFNSDMGGFFFIFIYFIVIYLFIFFH